MYVPATVFSFSLVTSRSISVSEFYRFNQLEVVESMAPELAVKVVGVHWEEILSFSGSCTTFVLVSSMRRMTSDNWALA